MNVSEWWQSVVMPDRWRVSGVSVRALSVWHLFAMDQMENAFVVGGEINLDQVAGMLLICQTDYESGRRLFVQERNILNRIGRIYGKLKKRDEKSIIDAAMEYFSTCTETPERWTEEKKGRGIAAPLCYHIVLCLCSQYNFKLVDAWNCNYAEARSLMEAWREREGDTSLITPYQRSLIRQASTIKETATT